MHEYPSIPELTATSPDFLEGGHLWIQEYVTGRLCRFQMAESGLLTFGGPTARIDPDAVPPHYVEAVESIRSSLDRDRLRAGTDSVESYTFFGVVPLRTTIEYDWDSTPAYLGVDIWDGTQDRFTPPDVTERVFETVGLEMVPTFEKEVPARQFNPKTYSIPRSLLGDSKAAGVILRKKTGERAKLLSDSVGLDSMDSEREQVAVSGLESSLEPLISREYLQSVLLESEPELERMDVSVLTRRVAGRIARRDFDRFQAAIEKRPAAFFDAVEARIRTVSNADT